MPEVEFPARRQLRRALQLQLLVLLSLGRICHGRICECNTTAEGVESSQDLCTAGQVYVCGSGSFCYTLLTADGGSKEVKHGNYSTASMLFERRCASDSPHWASFCTENKVACCLSPPRFFCIRCCSGDRCNAADPHYPCNVSGSCDGILFNMSTPSTLTTAVSRPPHPRVNYSTTSGVPEDSTSASAKSQPLPHKLVLWLAGPTLFVLQLVHAAAAAFDNAAGT